MDGLHKESLRKNRPSKPLSGVMSRAFFSYEFPMVQGPIIFPTHPSESNIEKKLGLLLYSISKKKQKEKCVNNLLCSTCWRVNHISQGPPANTKAISSSSHFAETFVELSRVGFSTLNWLFWSKIWGISSPGIHATGRFTYLKDWFLWDQVNLRSSHRSVMGFGTTGWVWYQSLKSSFLEGTPFVETKTSHHQNWEKAWRFLA